MSVVKWVNRILIGLIILTWVAILDSTFVVPAKPDAELEPHVANYYSLTRYICGDKKPINYTRHRIRLDSINGTSIGICKWKLNGFEIVIDKDFWNAPGITNEDREQLMFHELSHCVLDRDHNFDDKYHYMYPSQIYLPQQTYIPQVLKDMEEFCNE